MQEALMNSRVKVLEDLVADGCYPVEPRQVAEAILARGRARRIMGGVEFRNECATPEVRSFRVNSHARSFRLQSGRRRRAATML
jgi:hypothetical protein